MRVPVIFPLRNQWFRRGKQRGERVLKKVDPAPEFLGYPLSWGTPLPGEGGRLDFASKKLLVQLWEFGPREIFF